MQYKIKRIGSFNDSKKDNIVRLSKQERNRLGVQNGFVRVKKGDKSEIAIVGKQSVDLISFPEICTINQLLSDSLNAHISDTVEITNDVTPEEVSLYSEQNEYEKRIVKGTQIKKDELKRAERLLDSLFASEQEGNENGRA